MNASDFRRIALGLEGAMEGSHRGSPDFSVGGRIFATLACQDEGYGNLMLAPEQQAEFVGESPEVFLPIPGGWGKMGMTHIRLAQANEDVLTGALRTAWKLRVKKNTRTRKKSTPGRDRIYASVRGEIESSQILRDGKPLHLPILCHACREFDGNEAV